MDECVVLHIVQVAAQFFEELKKPVLSYKPGLYYNCKGGSRKNSSPLFLFTHAQMYPFLLKMFADVLKVMNLRSKSPWCNFHSFFVSLRCKSSLGTKRHFFKEQTSEEKNPERNLFRN